MSHRHVLAAAVVALSTGIVSIGTSGSALATTMMVTTCGQSVSGNAVLAGDLDCSAGPDPALDLMNGTRLSLGGFTLTGKTTAIFCEVGSCKITGPGTIQGSVPQPNSNTIGVFAAKHAKLDGVTVTNWNQGIYVLGPGSVKNSTIQGNHMGILGAPLRATDSSFVGNYYGTWASEGTYGDMHYIFWSSRIVRCTFSGNTIDVSGYKRPTVRNSACSTSDHLTIPATPWGGGDEWGVCP